MECSGSSLRVGRGGEGTHSLARCGRKIGSLEPNLHAVRVQRTIERACFGSRPGARDDSARHVVHRGEYGGPEARVAAQRLFPHEHVGVTS
jgi:hypothetical protein